MKILALDSSGLVASVALVEEDRLIAEYTLQYKKTHSQTLLPMLDEIRKMTELDLASVDAIAIAAGPGSFTGLRIGAATVKGLGSALNKPIVPVSTLAAMAYQIYATDYYICPIMDARRNQVYTAVYRWKDGELVAELADDAMPIEDIARRVGALEKKVVFLGDGVPVHEEFLKEKLGVKALFSPAFANRQRAAALATLGGEYFSKGKSVTAAEFAPIYLRMSQAERERKEKEMSEN